MCTISLIRSKNEIMCCLELEVKLTQNCVAGVQCLLSYWQHMDWGFIVSVICILSKPQNGMS